MRGQAIQLLYSGVSGCGYSTKNGLFADIVSRCRENGLACLADNKFIAIVARRPNIDCKEGGKRIKEQYADTGGVTDLVFAVTTLRA